MNKSLLLAMLLAFTGCTMSQDLASERVNVDVRMAADQITVNVSSVNDLKGNVADTSHCLTLSDSTTITANGLPGTLVNVGGLPFDADSCEAAELTVAFATLPEVIDIVLDDGTAKLEIKLVRDSFKKFQVTKCGAASCTASE